LELLVLLDGKMPHRCEWLEDSYGLISHQFTIPGEYDLALKFSQLTLGEAELSAAATLIDYWNPGVNNAVWITVCLVVAVGINLFGVGSSLTPMNVNHTG
jgi:amino acid transporter